MKRVKGMYTVEAAVIMPLAMFMIAVGIRIGIELYMETEASVTAYEDVEEIDEISMVHNIQKLLELL